MSNSALATYRKISPNRTSPRNHKIDTITIHCVVGQLSAERIADLFVPTSRKASCNYAIGYDGKIALVVEEKDRSWCTSSASNDNRAVTIEVASDTTHPYAVKPKAYSALLDLVTDICRRNGIKELKWRGDKSLIGQVDKQNMTVHRWFANKACPGDYLYNLHGEIAAEVTKRLKGEEDMDLDQFKELMQQFRAELRDNDASTYSADARTWAVNNKLIEGGSDTSFNGMWEDFMTREQFVTVLYRFAQMMGKA